MKNKILVCPNNCCKGEIEDSGFNGQELQSVSTVYNAHGDWIESDDSEYISGPEEYYCNDCGTKAHWEEIDIDGEEVHLQEPIDPNNLPYNNPFDVVI
jgi:hypothetical protein